MSKLTLLFVDHASVIGGAERSLLLLLKHLDRDRWQLHLACPPGDLADAARALDVSVHPLPLPRLRRSVRFPFDLLAHAARLARLARALDARALVANTVRAAFYTAPAARLARRPFIWHMRDFWLSESRPRRLLPDTWGKRLLCTAAARVVANSQATAQHLPCPDRVWVIYNGIEVDRYDPLMEEAPFREAHGIPRDVPLVGTVGRLRPWKGQDRFLRVLARVRRIREDVWGLVVGGTPFQVEDDYPQRLRVLAQELGVAEQVVFTGHLNDVRPALAAMDVFVHAGDPEPFGLVVVEAMAMAKPVVAFAHGALPEIVVDGETGLLVPPGDEDTLAARVLRLLIHRDEAQAMGERCRARVEAYFHIVRTVRAFEEALTTVITDTPRTMHNV